MTAPANWILSCYPPNSIASPNEHYSDYSDFLLRERRKIVNFPRGFIRMMLSANFAPDNCASRSGSIRGGSALSRGPAPMRFGLAVQSPPGRASQFRRCTAVNIDHLSGYESRLVRGQKQDRTSNVVGSACAGQQLYDIKEISKSVFAGRGVTGGVMICPGRTQLTRIPWRAPRPAR